MLFYENTFKNVRHSSLSQSESYMSVEISGGIKANSKCSKGVSFRGSFERVRDPMRSSCIWGSSIGNGLLNGSILCETFGVDAAKEDEGDPMSLVCEDRKLPSSL